MLSQNRYENSLPGGAAVLEVSGENGPQRFVPLKQTLLSGEVTGPLAALRLTQTYRYSRQESDKVLAAAYRFPLPGDAAVTRVLARFGEVEVASELQERSAAEEAYGKAVDEGRQAALLTRESPDVFTLLLAGIRPDEDVTVQLDYVQAARAEGAGWSLRMPLTTAPRFVRADELGSRHAQGQPLAVLRDPGHRFALDLHFRGAALVESLTHALACEGDGADLHVSLQDGQVIPDRDCVLRWLPRQEQSRPALEVWLEQDTGSALCYFLALAVPPARPAGQATSREAIVLVDHSGSMGGAKWVAADWTVKRFLGSLGPGDTFSLGLFHDTCTWFASRPQKADPATVARAMSFLEAHRDSGGTELGVALEQALRQARSGGEAARHVMVVTDAEVSDGARILRLADDESRRADRRRISVVCIDAAPNSTLVLQLAERGGGVARFLTSSPEEGDIATALDEVLADWDAPLLADLRLHVSGTGLCGAGRQVLPDQGALDLGDLPAGRPVWAVGRVAAGDSHPAFRLATRSGLDLGSCQGSDGPPAGGAIRACFGARRLLVLEYLRGSGRTGEELAAELARLGYDVRDVLGTESKPMPLYAENARRDPDAALRALLVQESLHYGLVCSETALVAARKEAGRPVQGLSVIGNALPQGWSEDFTISRASIGASFASAMPSPRRWSGFARALRSPAASGMPAPSRQAQRYRPLVMPDAAGQSGSTLVHSGVPQFAGEEALLFESPSGGGRGPLPSGARLAAIEVSYLQPPTAAALQGLVLLVFVGDLTAPRASVSLVDILRLGGSRPLNMLRRGGEPVRIVLQRQPGGAQAAPALDLMLRWS